MKSKSTAYFLWLFLGFFGGHKFYLDKSGMGILYFFTFGIFFIGWFIDLFTLGSQVEAYNALISGRNTTNTNNIVVNIPSPTYQNTQNLSEQLHELQALKEKGLLTDQEFSNQKAKILS